jgi:glycosyltransferase involved in cell wall biosynthesis
MLRRCDLALANSDYTRREVLSSYSEVNPAQVITLYKGVDLSFFNSVKTRLKVAGACQFAFVGSNFRIKQLHLVVEAYANLKAPNCSLRIAGCTLEEFIKEYPQLAKAARSPGVIFHGRLDRASVRDLLLRSDSLLLPSRQEALGVAALEAIACGCRVIGARVGGIPEIIVGDEVGRLVDQPSVDAWREAMVAEVAVASPMGLHRSLLLERFSAQHMLAELRHLYLNCNFK